MTQTRRFGHSDKHVKGKPRGRIRHWLMERMFGNSVSYIQQKTAFFFSMSGSVSKRIKCLHTKTKESVSFNKVICLTWVCVCVCVPYTVPQHPQIPPKKTNLSPKDTFWNGKKTKTLNLSRQFGMRSINTRRTSKESYKACRNTVTQRRLKKKAQMGAVSS